jgi:hypothetical protein
VILWKKEKRKATKYAFSILKNYLLSLRVMTNIINLPPIEEYECMMEIDEDSD